MAAKMQAIGLSQHTAGIFADMSVDGPVIGTLVLVVDRAKNLPNRKTIGKQNPYCAARLGKEANKTETDQRGGQTPRWDQELRFTVHDSMDYHSMKISVFSEDKRTDLIGEAWVNLDDIVKLGGGKGDLWQTLNYKGKYAGEIRIELTFYDSRPRPEKSEGDHLISELKQNTKESSKMKRRPLPEAAPWAHGQLTPETIPVRAVPGRAKHGPRDIRAPMRPNSMPPDLSTLAVAPAAQPPAEPQPVPHHPHQPLHNYNDAPTIPHHHPTHTSHHNAHEQLQNIHAQDTLAYDSTQAPDFLPDIPPSRQQIPSTGSIRHAENQSASWRPHDQIGLTHSHSAPSVPFADPESYDVEYQLRGDYPTGPVPGVDYQHQYASTYHRRSMGGSDLQYDHDNSVPGDSYDQDDGADAVPPPPPVHSNSAPIVPHYGNMAHAVPSPHISQHPDRNPHARYNSAPNVSSSQHVERSHAHPRQSNPYNGPARGHSMDMHQPHTSELPHVYNDDASGRHNTSGPLSHGHPRDTNRQLANRRSVGDPHSAPTPPRAHPLSHEVHRPRSPLPEHPAELPGSSPAPREESYPYEFHHREAAPLARPRAISPRPTQHREAPQQHSAPQKSLYSLQFPVRAHESSDASPLSTSRQSTDGQRRTPIRKSVSPAPTPDRIPLTSASSTPYSPDSFDIHNPNAASSLSQLQSNSVSPHTPYQIRPADGTHPRDPHTGPIVDWHGQEVDPSDHLPVDSWAPEPQKKTPTKSYGHGRDRDFGPRHLSKDTVVSFRSKASPTAHSPPASTPLSQLPASKAQSIRTKLQKRSPLFGSSSDTSRDPMIKNYSENTYSPSPAGPYDQQQQHYGRNDHDYSYPHGGPYSSEHSDALAREISNIDLGSSGGGRGSARQSLPAPVAYVPVRSHKDRRTFY